MAFDFLGTFNKSQFDRFMTFARSQFADISGRVAHLNYEKLRAGSLTFTYDGGGVPTAYSASSSTSTYIGGLVAAYEALGGDVKFDLQVRTRAQSVFLVAGTDTSPAQYMSNGEVVGGKGLRDSASAEYIRTAREWMHPALHYRREYLERKIRRVIDYVDQLDAELELLASIQQPADTEGSLEWVATKISELLTNDNYLAIYDDKGRDPHGKSVYAPFLPYSKRGTTLPQVEPGVAGRDDGGFIPAGVTGDEEGLA